MDKNSRSDYSAAASKEPLRILDSIKIRRESKWLIIKLPMRRNWGIAFIIFCFGAVLLVVARFGFEGMPEPSDFIDSGLVSLIISFFIPGPGYIQLIIFLTGLAFLLLWLLIFLHSVTTVVMKDKIIVTHRWFYIPFHTMVAGAEDIDDLTLKQSGSLTWGGKTVKLYSVMAVLNKKVKKKFDLMLADNLKEKEEGDYVLDLVISQFYYGE